MNNFLILSKRLQLKDKGLPDARVVSSSTKTHGLALHFL